MLKTLAYTDSLVYAPVPFISLSEREFYEHLAKDCGVDLADKVQQFVDKLLTAHDTLDQHVTLHSMKIRLDLQTDEFTPRPILQISWHGNIRVAAEVLEAIADLKLPSEIKTFFVKQIAAIDVRMLPEQEAGGGYRRTKSGPRNLPDVAARFGDLAEAVSGLVENVQRAAEES